MQNTVTGKYAVMPTADPAYDSTTKIYMNINTSLKNIYWTCCRQVNCQFCQSYPACNSNIEVSLDKNTQNGNSNTRQPVRN